MLLLLLLVEVVGLSCIRTRIRLLYSTADTLPSATSDDSVTESLTAAAVVVAGQALRLREYYSTGPTSSTSIPSSSSSSSAFSFPYTSKSSLFSLLSFLLSSLGRSVGRSIGRRSVGVGWRTESAAKEKKTSILYALPCTRPLAWLFSSLLVCSSLVFTLSFALLLLSSPSYCVCLVCLCVCLCSVWRACFVTHSVSDDVAGGGALLASKHRRKTCPSEAPSNCPHY